MKKNSVRTLMMAGLFMSLLVWGLAQAGDSGQARAKNGPNGKTSDDSSQTMTADMKAKVASILARYKAASLTAADARAINDAFRAAGIRRGPGQKEAIEAAGFDPKKISALDPPPEPNDVSGSKATAQKRK